MEENISGRHAREQVIENTWEIISILQKKKVHELSTDEIALLTWHKEQIGKWYEEMCTFTL